MVTLLPRKSPTPMAPPMAIMVSCLWLRRRGSPSICCEEGAFSAGSVTCWLVMAGSGWSKHHEIDVLLQDLYHRLDVVHCVVYMKRDPQAVITARGDDVGFGQFLY